MKTTEIFPLMKGSYVYTLYEKEFNEVKKNRTFIIT